MKKKIPVFLSAVLTALVFLSVTAVATTPPSGVIQYQGADVYEGNSDYGQINWAEVAQSQQFAYIKISEGENYVDRAYKDNIAGAKAAGIQWGPYEFLRLYSPSSCRQQAINFWNRIKGTGYTMIPAVDCESYDYCGTSAQVNACIRAFVDEFRSLAGYNPVLYTFTSYAKNNALAESFSDCKLWQADYRGYSGDTGFPSWVVWQYSSTGDVPGIQNHYVDMDKATNDVFLGSSPSPVVVQPVTSSEVYAVGSLPYAVNATAGTDFDVRNANGTAVSGREVSKGDPMIILGVNYDTQLAEVLYPSYSQGSWIHGFIRNLESLIHNTGYKRWLNGNTPEPVYNASGARIGTIYPHEQATVLYKTGGKTAVLYDTDKGLETKSGYVSYAGN